MHCDGARAISSIGRLHRVAGALRPALARAASSAEGGANAPGRVKLMTRANKAAGELRGPILLMAIFVLAAAGFSLIFRAADWRAGALLSRYCDAPERHLAAMHQVLSGAAPAGEGTRRPFAIAAKLLFLAPRRPGEPVDAYIRRLRRRIQESCR